jgi:hypothetical protein
MPFTEPQCLHPVLDPSMPAPCLSQPSDTPTVEHEWDTRLKAHVERIAEEMGCTCKPAQN